MARFQPYTEEEKASLSQKYTPEQMEAIEAGETSISAQDLATQGAMRDDEHKLPYISDLSTIDPVIDHPVTPRSRLDPQNRPQGDASTRSGRGSSSRKEEEEEDPHMKRLIRQTGYTKQQIRRLRLKSLVAHRVTNQTRMGKIQSIYHLSVAGDGKGMLGIGEGKAHEDGDARRQAMMAAIRNMKPVPRYEERTIFGEVTGKVGAVELRLSARPPGFGLRCQHLIFEMARAAGIGDLSGKVLRSRNKMNVCKATFQALMQQKLPEDIARARGRKLVDVRKVYYGGKTF
ncbi:hypothetical protein EV356DRAFT_438529 [Viridothelium virens]|uniref:Small ribosomal subunit protein uS5m n=1 Tax=Viridothelium virens TaxID=1048519 RepID=A0A6A6HQY4_VIRVR|nr:hypothetical protein EV356DRAFT_438529 [Viridothelium virens]